MGNVSSPGVESGRGVTLTPQPLLVPTSKKSRAIPLFSLRAFVAYKKGETYLPTHIPTHPPTYLPTNLRTYLPSYLRTYLPTNLPTELSSVTFHMTNRLHYQQIIYEGKSENKVPYIIGTT
jgi:hypothetical protein